MSVPSHHPQTLRRTALSVNYRRWLRLLQSMINLAGFNSPARLGRGDLDTGQYG